ncbi:MAG TPA: DUF4012 domain-containing protein [Acidimicrobiales bacterium]|nr:DUF4012 domain-containing protein [Acidimicrobiales bacterium]
MSWHVWLGVAAGAGAAAWAVAAGSRRLSAWRSLPAVWVLTAAGAVGAVLAPAAPTGVGPLDASYRAALVVLATMAGSRSRRRAKVAACLIVLVGTAGHGFMVLAAVGLGLSAALRTAGRRASVVGAAVGACVGVAALHLSWPSPARVTAGMAGLAVGILAASSYRLLSRRRRRRARLAVGGLALAGAVLSVPAAVSLLLAGRHAQSGLADAQAGVRAAKAGRTELAAADFGLARSDLTAAARPLGSWWAPISRAVPVVGRNVHTVAVAAAYGRDVAAAGASLAVAADGDALRPVKGRFDLTALSRLQPTTRTAAAELTAAVTAVRAQDSPWLIAPLADRLDRLTAQLGAVDRQARNLAVAARLLPAMFGSGGTRRYLVVFLDTAENRGGGGLATGYAQLDVAGGQMSLTRLGATGAGGGDLLTIPPGGATITHPADYVQRYSEWNQGEYWINTFMSPDFPSDAEVAAQVYPQDGGQPVDGVVGVDPDGLAALLSLTGPIHDPDWSAPITAQNVAEVVLHQEYDVFSAPEQNSKRTEFLVNVGHETYQAALDSHLPGPAALGAALAPAVAGRHIQLWSAHPAEERLFDDIGASGRMSPFPSDYLELVTMNASNDKSDWYLHRSVAYAVDFNRDAGRASATATVTLTNDEPATGQPAYVIGGGPAPYPAGVSEQYFELYSALPVTEVTGAPVDDGYADTALGRQVYSGFVSIPPGGTATLVFHLSGQLPATRPYSLVVDSQPTVLPDALKVRLSDGARSVERETSTMTATKSFAFPYGF